MYKTPHTKTHKLNHVARSFPLSQSSLNSSNSLISNTFPPQSTTRWRHNLLPAYILRILLY